MNGQLQSLVPFIRRERDPMYPINELESESEYKQGDDEYNYCIKLQQLGITSLVLLSSASNHTKPNTKSYLTKCNYDLRFLITQLKPNLPQCII
jgi:hypothetical protein